MRDRHAGQESPCHRVFPPAGLKLIEEALQLLQCGLGRIGRLVPKVLHHVHDRHAFRSQLRGGGMHGIIERAIEPQREPVIGPCQPAQGQVEASRPNGNAAGRPSRQRRIGRHVEQVAGFLWLDSQNGRPGAQFLTTGEFHGHTVGSAMHGFRPGTGAKISPARGRLIAQAVDERLPTAVEIPNIAGESELQLDRGRHRRTSAQGRRSRC